MYKILTFFLFCSLFVNGQILFSEYAEGSSYNKYLEIYNYSNEEVNLSEYAFPSCSNGCDQEGEWDYMNYFPDGAIIPVGDVYIITHPYAADSSSDYYTEEIAVFSDHQFQFLGNGNDAVGLVNTSSGQILDVIGNMSTDVPDDGWDVAGIQEATKDHVLIRKSNVLIGNNGDWVSSSGTNMNDSEWIVLDNEVWTNLGFHEYDSGVEFIFGCTDSEGLNYNPEATIDDGSCEYTEVLGCTNTDAINYNPDATNDDGSCIILGCTDESAINYNPEATDDDNSCQYAEIDGCTDPFASNYNPLATNDDGSCEYAEMEGCEDSTACNYDPAVTSALFSYMTTDSNMVIAIEALVGNSIGLEAGDIIGVFYTNDADELTCAGAAAWGATEAIAIAAWGSESGLDNGFAPAEQFTFVIQKSDGTMFLLESIMNNNIPFSSMYEPNGFGQVLEFTEMYPYFDLENCEYPEEYYDCFGNCLNDVNGDGICDEFELGVQEEFSKFNLIKTVDILGRDYFDEKSNKILFEIFDNGRITKKIIID